MKKHIAVVHQIAQPGIPAAFHDGSRFHHITVLEELPHKAFGDACFRCSLGGRELLIYRNYEMGYWYIHV